MKAGLRGNLEKLHEFKRKLREFPTTLAITVASKAAPELTGLARGAYVGGRSVYGEARPTGVDGGALTLQATGATLAKMQFESIGTVVRVKLGTPWARFLVGKYSILPMGVIPVEWSRALAAIVQAEAPKLL